MRQLHVCFIVKNTASAFERVRRNMGLFSYDVPEFTWRHISPGDGEFDVRKLGEYFDLIFHEDGGNWCDYVGCKMPIVYYSIDSTLSDRHLYDRIQQGKKANLVLVDHDRPARFSGCRNVLQFPHCVNDKMFRDYGEERTVDIAFHCGRNDIRAEIRQRLDVVAKSGNYVYRSNVMGAPEYARAMARAKIVVNWPRVPINRPHRVFDAMATGACLLTGTLPYIEQDKIENGKHYVGRDSPQELYQAIDGLLSSGDWERYALAGKELAIKEHAWSVRARQLRELINSEFGI